LQRSESDIDIALVVDGVTDMFNLQLQLMRLRRKIDLRIEPHPIDKHDFNSSNPLAYEIEKNGIELRIP
jgi:predicted nucleotidyltransferase